MLSHFTKILSEYRYISSLIKYNAYTAYMPFVDDNGNNNTNTNKYE